MSEKYLKLLITAIPVLLISCSGPDSSKPAQNGPRGLQADVLVIQTEQISEKFYSTGTIIPSEYVALKSEIGGRLTGIHFKEGERVSAGALLFSIDDRDYQAELSRIRVQLDLAGKEKSRNLALFEQQAVSQEVLDASISKVAELETQAKLLEVKISRCSIRAPFSGKIGLRKVSPGEYITTGQDLVDLVQVNPLKIEFEIPERLSVQVTPGMMLRIYSEETNDSFTAQVYALDSRINESSRNLKVRAIVEKAPPGMLPGTFVKVILELKEMPQAIMLPAEAVIPELNAMKVYKVNQGVVQSQQITVGLRTESRIQVLSGLSAGDSVLVTGILQAREGLPVSVKPIKTEE